MSIGRDPLSDYQRSLGESIENHRAQDLPSGGNNLFGRSVFGFLSQTFGGMLPRVPSVGGMSLGIGPDIGDQLKRQGVGLATNSIIGAIFGTGGPKFERDRINQLLEDKGFVGFHFDDNQDLSFTIPFFENPKISESRDAKYANNEIMNRNEPWRLWTGASPRKVKVDFSITKPHVQSFTDGALEALATDFQSNIRGGKNLKQDFQFYIRGEQNLRSEFAKEIRPGPVDQFGQQSVWGSDRLAASRFDSDEDFTVPMSSHNPAAAQDAFFAASELSTVHDKVWLHIMTSLQSVRAGVVRSNSNETLNGPPTLRLKFGGMFHETEKYILKSYGVKYDERAGYEESSLGLLPRKIDISLTLESFSQGIGENDSILNPPGWDTILVIQ